MGGLTKAPLSMLDTGPNAQPNDRLVFNGDSVEAQAPEGASQVDLYVANARYNADTGVLELIRSDASVLQVPGFTTAMSIGIGPRGATGPQGLPGPSGRNGKDGSNGIPGCTGPKGDPGPMGPAGGGSSSSGSGQRGATGPTGPTGPKGATGPAGIDGERPTYVSSPSASSEKINSGRVMQWGRFTDATAGQIKSVLLPSALTRVEAVASISFIMQWVNPASNVANKVKVDSINGGNVSLSVVTSMLATMPDGSGGTTTVPTTGWDFYWFLVQ